MNATNFIVFTVYDDYSSLTVDLVKFEYNDQFIYVNYFFNLIFSTNIDLGSLNNISHFQHFFSIQIFLHCTRYGLTLYEIDCKWILKIN